jgi:hypothetical protein
MSFAAVKATEVEDHIVARLQLACQQSCKLKF